MAMMIKSVRMPISTRAHANSFDTVPTIFTKCETRHSDAHVSSEFASPGKESLSECPVLQARSMLLICYNNKNPLLFTSHTSDVPSFDPPCHPISQVFVVMTMNIQLCRAAWQDHGICVTEETHTVMYNHHRCLCLPVSNPCTVESRLDHIVIPFAQLYQAASQTNGMF